MHYSWIKSFSRLMVKQTEKSLNSVHYCKKCLSGYRLIEALKKHDEYCSLHRAMKIEVPEPDMTLSFTHNERSMRVPFVV